jgi:hypothetical protein
MGVRRAGVGEGVNGDGEEGGPKGRKEVDKEGGRIVEGVE